MSQIEIVWDTMRKALPKVILLTVIIALPVAFTLKVIDATKVSKYKGLNCTDIYREEGKLYCKVQLQAEDDKLFKEN